MNVTSQTIKEAEEIMSTLKNKLLNPFKTEKQQVKLINLVAEMLQDYKLRERVNVGAQIKEQYRGFIPTPNASIANRLRFLFTGSVK